MCYKPYIFINILHLILSKYSITTLIDPTLIDKKVCREYMSRLNTLMNIDPPPQNYERDAQVETKIDIENRVGKILKIKGKITVEDFRQVFPDHFSFDLRIDQCKTIKNLKTLCTNLQKILTRLDVENSHYVSGYYNWRYLLGLATLESSAYIYSLISDIYMSRNSFRKAENMINKINNNFVKKRKLEVCKCRSTVFLYSVKGDDLLISQLINKITYADLKAQTLCDIVIVLLNKRNIQKAIEIAGKITVDYTKAEALLEIVVKLLKQGNTQKAIEIAGKITVDYTKAEALLEIVVKLLKQGNTQKAKEIEGKITDIENHPEALLEIVIVLLDKGNIQKAIEIASKITDPYMRAEALCAIVIALMKTGNISEVMKLVDERIHLPYGRQRDKIKSTCQIITVLLERGNFLVEKKLTMKMITHLEEIRNFRRKRYYYDLILTSLFQKPEEIYEE